MTLTVHMGGVPFEFDTSEWNKLIGQQLNGAFEFETLSAPKRAVVRIGIKLLMHELLDKFEQASARGFITAPPPDRARADEDVLTYGASYLAAFLIAEVEKLQFVADYEEAPNGAIRIRGLRPAPALAGNESSFFLAAGPTNGPDDAEVVTPAAALESAESEGNSGITGGYVDLGRDQGQRENLRGETASA